LRVIEALKTLKRLVRSRDAGFAFGSGELGSRQQLRWKGHSITYRAKTSDFKHIERLLLLGKRCEYNLPQEVNPKYILDAGANIGLAALFFSEYFPEAKIVCCEPVPANLELLKLNTAGLPNLTIVSCALGRTTSMGSRVQINANDYANVKVVESNSGDTPIYDYAELLKISNIPFFDLIKIDIEGNEYDFLSSMTEAQLAQCNWIVGEVHGAEQWRLLDLLSRQFSIDIRKTMGDKPSKFHACNLSKVETFLRGFDLSILQK
jgi:FkbM family methyltransferase